MDNQPPPSGSTQPSVPPTEAAGIQPVPAPESPPQGPEVGAGAPPPPIAETRVLQEAPSGAPPPGTQQPAPVAPAGTQQPPAAVPPPAVPAPPQQPGPATSGEPAQPPAPGWGGSQPPGWGTAPPGWGGSSSGYDNPTGYPVRVTIDTNQPMNQLWGIPIFGIMVRALLCLPHFIILAFWGMLIFLVYLVVWIPILLRGRYPSWAFGFVGGYVRWTMRVTAYVLLLTAAYPPFSTQPGYAVEVDFDEEQDINPLWGIPLLGILARVILGIPHLVVLWLFSFVVGIVNLIAWIPVLLTGRYPSWGYSLVGGYYRWYVRVWAYVGLMAAPYPPFTTR